MGKRAYLLAGGFASYFVIAGLDALIPGLGYLVALVILGYFFVYGWYPVTNKWYEEGHPFKAGFFGGYLPILAKWIYLKIKAWHEGMHTQPVV